MNPTTLHIPRGVAIDTLTCDETIEEVIIDGRVHTLNVKRPDAKVRVTGLVDTLNVHMNATVYTGAGDDAIGFLGQVFVSCERPTPPEPKPSPKNVSVWHGWT